MIDSHVGRSLLRLLLLLPVTILGARAQTFDHSRLDRILSTAVSNGNVDYERIRKSDELTLYLASLEHARPDELPVDERLAFWINAYNALVIRSVLDNPGMRRPIDVAGFFDRRSWPVAGRRLTLNQIENDVLRTGFHEPLIHFGLVCAARSCPPLRAHAYSGRTVRTELAGNAEAYLASAQNRLDATSRTLYLSKIFDWYRGDFRGDQGIRAFVAAHGTPAMKQMLAREPNPPIAFLEYDWDLNGR